MISPRSIAILLSVVFLFHYATSAKQAVVSKKSKLCGNVACEEVLFKSRVKRVMGVNGDPSFLNLVENSYISVVAVKFSDRPDIMEGKLNGEGSTGFFYAGAIELMPYAEFLRSAIEEKKEMLMISQNGADVGDKRVVGVVHSETDLVRDYNAKSAQAAAEQGLPAPEPMPIPEPTGGHGHSHGGHGHSHGGHGHSHGGHGHSHGGHPAPTPAPPAPPSETVTPTPETVPVPEAIPEVVTTTPIPVTETTPEAVQEAPKEEVKAEINLNSVLGSPPTLNPTERIELSEMDAEIERMIREEEIRLAKSKEAASEETTQPPLVLSSLPAEPIIEAVTSTPEVVPEVVPVVESVPEVVPEVTTTPAPVEATPIVEQVTPEPVTLPPLVEEPTTPPPPLPVQEPIAQYIPPPPEVVEEVVTPAPIIEEVSTTPLPPAVQEEATGFCYKDECQGLQTTQEPPKSQDEEDFLKWEEERKKREAKPYEDAQASHHFRDLPIIPPKSAGIIDFVRSTFGLGNITDASVVLYLALTFLLASVVFHVIVRTLSSGPDSDVFDRQAYFNVVTKCKELQLQVQAKDAEIQKLQTTGAQQSQQNVPNHEPELLSLKQQINQLHNELQIAQTQRQEFELHCNQLREVSEQKEQQIVALNQTMNEYAERLEKSSAEVQEWARQLNEVQVELKESQQAAYTRQQELVTQQQEHESTHHKIQELTSEARTLHTRISQLEQANEELEIELKDLKLVNDGLHDNVQHLEKQLEKLQNESGSAAESGGSGWSDFGDVDEVEEKKEEKTPDASHSELADYRAKYKKYGEDMEELAALKIKLDEIEKELARYKSMVDKGERGKSDIEQKLRNAEADVADAKKKIEEITAEKKELGDRLNETVKTLNNTINKTSDTDKLITTLREEGFAKDKKLLDLEGELRNKDEKHREVELQMNQLKRQYVKLEAESFHQQMRLKRELDGAKSAVTLGEQNYSRDMFGNTSDSRKSADRNLASPLDNPIWDEPEYSTTRQMPTLQQEDYYSSGSNTMPSKRRNSRRSDHRLLTGLGGEMSPSDREEHSGKTKKEGPHHRRRSRSQGRQVPVYHDPYALNSLMPGSSDSSFMSQHAPGFQPLSGRHSKSGHLVYSSGGSNGGRSPPPEMPLLSAIPPPGARKPTSKRADPTLYGPK